MSSKMEWKRIFFWMTDSKWQKKVSLFKNPNPTIDRHTEQFSSNKINRVPTRSLVYLLISFFPLYFTLYVAKKNSISLSVFNDLIGECSCCCCCYYCARHEKKAKPTLSFQLEKWYALCCPHVFELRMNWCCIITASIVIVSSSFCLFESRNCIFFFILSIRFFDSFILNG